MSKHDHSCKKRETKIKKISAKKPTKSFIRQLVINLLASYIPNHTPTMANNNLTYNDIIGNPVGYFLDGHHTNPSRPLYCQGTNAGGCICVGQAARLVATREFSGSLADLHQFIITCSDCLNTFNAGSENFYLTPHAKYAFNKASHPFANNNGDKNTKFGKFTVTGCFPIRDSALSRNRIYPFCSKGVSFLMHKCNEFRHFYEEFIIENNPNDKGIYIGKKRRGYQLAVAFQYMVAAIIARAVKQRKRIKFPYLGLPSAEDVNKLMMANKNEQSPRWDSAKSFMKDVRQSRKLVYRFNGGRNPDGTRKGPPDEATCAMSIVIADHRLFPRGDYVMRLTDVAWHTFAADEHFFNVTCGSIVAVITNTFLNVYCHYIPGLPTAADAIGTLRATFSPGCPDLFYLGGTQNQVDGDVVEDLTQQLNDQGIEDRFPLGAFIAAFNTFKAQMKGRLVTALGTAGVGNGRQYDLSVDFHYIRVATCQDHLRVELPHLDMSAERIRTAQDGNNWIFVLLFPLEEAGMFVRVVANNKYYHGDAEADDQANARANDEDDDEDDPTDNDVKQGDNEQKIRLIYICRGSYLLMPITAWYALGFANNNNGNLGVRMYLTLTPIAPPNQQRIQKTVIRPNDAVYMLKEAGGTQELTVRNNPIVPPILLRNSLGPAVAQEDGRYSVPAEEQEEQPEVRPTDGMIGYVDSNFANCFYA